jgi:hypothetical protein
MKHLCTHKHADARLNVHGDLGDAEGQQTEVTLGRRFDNEGYAHMERGERHGVLVWCW